MGIEEMILERARKEGLEKVKAEVVVSPLDLAVLCDPVRWRAGLATGGEKYLAVGGCSFSFGSFSLLHNRPKCQVYSWLCYAFACRKFVQPKGLRGIFHYQQTAVF